MTAAAIRARKPYAARNAALGLTFLGFASFCYWWAVRNFMPDDFADVPMPQLSDEELEKLREKYGLNEKNEAWRRSK